MRIIIEVDAVNNTATATTDQTNSKAVSSSSTTKTIDAGSAPSSLNSSSVDTSATATDMLAANPNAQSAGAAPNF